MKGFEPVAYRFSKGTITKLDSWPHGGNWEKLFTESQMQQAYEAGKAEMEFSWAGCSQQLKDACNDLEEAEKRITEMQARIEMLRDALTTASKWLPEKVHRGGVENGYWTDNGEAVLKDRAVLVEALAIPSSQDALREHDAKVIEDFLAKIGEPVAEVKKHTGALKDMAIIVWTEDQPAEGTKLYRLPEVKE